ncbi:MAG: sorbosone dehydrogenase [Flammeovirgaceae bacterium TMED32]|nr:MAG: sorbosone dehydrogenase [Flammeovirgaceae bacterium TMED32]
MKRLSFLTLPFIILACTDPASQVYSDQASLTSEEGLFLDSLIMPKGFQVEVYGRVDNARSMAMSPDGVLFVGNKTNSSVYALQDRNNDMKADTLYTIAKDLIMPNGIAFKDGALYVAEINKLWRYDAIEDNLNDPKATLIYNDFPEDSHHGWKYIAFGPDGKLYVPVGAPCNVCETKDDTYYASIVRMDADGTNREIVAKGVRNTVGLTWHPITGEMWFTDNGRDLLGDDLPPCELNRLSAAGQHFGFPYCHAGLILDPEFGQDKSCENYRSPAFNLGPHVAPLGLKFYTGNMFPPSYKNKIIIPEHGSWNRSKNAGHTGHKLSLVTEENGVGIHYETFVEGFLNKHTNTAWGRPVDILMLEDGSILISDDKSGTIYRMSYLG